MNDHKIQDTRILEICDLEVQFQTYGGHVRAVRGVSTYLNRGEILAIVGESGCGKSVTFQTIMGLIPMPPGKITGGTAKLDGFDLLKASDKEMESIRGRDISMIFQDPLSSLNPTMTVGDQIAEVLMRHQNLNYKNALAGALELMKKVQIPEAETRLNAYPHQFSGGMRQRVMIAMALACRPKVLIADEPTTALDVTIQGQIIELLRELKNEFGMSIILITHDLGVVASLADRVAVMYAGEIVESGDVKSIFKSPKHPYTAGLKASIPDPKNPCLDDLKTIAGSPPDLFLEPVGCAFAPRCSLAMKICFQASPPRSKFASRADREHHSQCWLTEMNQLSHASGEELYAPRI
jgi:oligopeptide/dipeptide ABC transporter ATP-binding protein